MTLPSGQQVEAERMAPPDLALVQVGGAAGSKLGGAAPAEPASGLSGRAVHSKGITVTTTGPLHTGSPPALPTACPVSSS